MKMMMIASIVTIASATAFAAYNEKEAQQMQKDITKLHLILATKLVIARDKGYTCEVESYPAEIISELGKFSYEPKVLANAVKQVPAFSKQLSKNFSYRRLLAGSSNGELALDKLAKLLVGSVFHSQARGAYGSTAQLQFEADGALKIRELDIDTLKWNERMSTYKILETIEKDSDKINRIQVDHGGEKGVVIYEMSNKDSVEKLIETGATSEYNGFFSSADECDA